MDRLRLAVVGCGTISRLNVPGYLRDDRCEIVALCDPIRERAEESAAEWRISPAIYTDYQEVLADPNVDAVELLTPTHLHADQIIAGLEAGKHVSCQKPIAVSIPEADRIGEAVARAEDAVPHIREIPILPSHRQGEGATRLRGHRRSQHGEDSHGDRQLRAYRERLQPRRWGRGVAERRRSESRRQAV